MKSKLLTTLLCGFLGSWGIHRFYLGKIGTGILWLLTAGCFGIGTIVDMIKLARNTLLDSKGQQLQKDGLDWLPYVFLGIYVLAIIASILTAVISSSLVIGLSSNL